MILRLKRLSICACNDTALNDGVEIGREYRVLEREDRPWRVEGFNWHCGACGREFPVSCVMAEESSGEFAPIPIELFEEEHN